MPIRIGAHHNTQFKASVLLFSFPCRVLKFWTHKITGFEWNPFLGFASRVSWHIWVSQGFFFQRSALLSMQISLKTWDALVLMHFTCNILFTLPSTWNYCNVLRYLCHIHYVHKVALNHLQPWYCQVHCWLSLRWHYLSMLVLFFMWQFLHTWWRGNLNLLS